MKRVVLMLAEGFEEIEAIVPADVMRRAGLDLKLVSVTGQREVAGSHDIRVMADVLFEEVDFSRVDLVVLPGGMPGASHLDAHEGVRRVITEMVHSGRLLGAICAAPMVPGHLGLLDKRKATCFPGFETHLYGARLTGEVVVVDGPLVTANGAGGALPFALKLVEQLLGSEVAHQTAHKMMVPGY